MIVTWINSIALNQYRRVIRTERLHHELQQSVQGNACLDLAAIDAARILRACRPPDRVLLEAQMRGVTAKEMAREQGITGDSCSDPPSTGPQVRAQSPGSTEPKTEYGSRGKADRRMKESEKETLRDAEVPDSKSRGSLCTARGLFCVPSMFDS